MKELYTVGVLGFSQKESGSLIKKIEGTSVGFKVDLEIESHENGDFEVDWSQELDGIILSSIGFKTSVTDIIIRIKEAFPLTEIILTSYSENYSLAISALRLGVRDILNGPVQKSGLITALSKVKHYRDLVYRSKSFGNILGLFNYFGNYSGHEEESKLFKKINEYTYQNFFALPFLVFSFPETANKKSQSTPNYRFRWNKKEFDNKYGMKNINELFESVDFEEFFNVKSCFIYKVIKERTTVFINLGEKDKQILVGAFSTETFLLKENQISFEFFVKLIRNSFSQMVALNYEKGLVSLVHIDDVTGLYNQRKLSADLDEAIQKNKRYKHEFAVLFIDIDHFKNVNDNYGHRIGSLILIKMAQILKKILRETDLIYRYGGDEFVVIIPNSGMISELVHKIGLRILSVFAKTIYRPENEIELSLSVSIGIAEFPRDAATKDAIIEMADQMMYRAKESGRGKVCYARELLK